MKERFDASKSAASKWWNKNKNDESKVPQGVVNEDAVDRRLASKKDKKTAEQQAAEAKHKAEMADIKKEQKRKEKERKEKHKETKKRMEKEKKQAGL